jgi:hypothetical protein
VIKRWFVSLGAACVLFLCAQHYYRSTIASRLPILNSAPCDFLPYYQAAQHIVHRESPFLADGYIYPPLLAFALTPLSAVDYVTARRLWFAISQLLLIAAAILLWRRFGRDLASACWIAIVWAFGGAASEALAVGQLGPPLAFLIVTALTSRTTTRGAAIATGFALKLFPGLLGVAVLLRRERRAICTMIAGGIAAVVIPWAAVALFLHGPSGAAKGSAWTGTPATLSWSLPSLAVRILDPTRDEYLTPSKWMLGTNLEHFHLAPHLAAAGLAVSILVLAAGLFALVRAVGLRIREEQTPWVLAALTSLALIASPVCWTHYQVLQYPVVAMLLIDSSRHRQWVRCLGVLALAALVYPLPMYWMDTLSHQPAAALGTIFFWSAVSPLASIGVFAVSVSRAARAVLARERQPHWLNLPDYSRLPAATPLAPLHDDRLSPSLGRSGR